MVIKLLLKTRHYLKGISESMKKVAGSHDVDWTPLRYIDSLYISLIYE